MARRKQLRQQKNTAPLAATPAALAICAVVLYIPAPEKDAAAALEDALILLSQKVAAV